MKYKDFYINQLSDLTDDTEVIVAGWVEDLRDLGKIKFLKIKDYTDSTQVIWKVEESPVEVGKLIETINQNDVIKVKGTVRKSRVAKKGFELVAKEIEVLSKSKHPLPLEIRGKIGASLDVRLDNRPIDLMRPRTAKIFKLFSEVLKISRNFFYKNGFVEVVTPRIISTATEGGANLFELSYFDKKAFLAQSPQLYKEQLTMGLEKVFEIGTFFRAEPFDTTRHLNEFVSLDIEVAFADYRDVMEILANLIKTISEELNERSKEYDEVLNEKFLEYKDKEIESYSYEEIVDMVIKKGGKISYGEDISSEDIKLIRDLKDKFFFVTDWPENTKPFYIKVKDDGTTESFDLMFGELEICSGGTREENREKLESRITRMRLNLNSFSEHLKFFSYGMPPHAGWAIGFNRLMMIITGESNIRETTLYPRDKNRITP
ncbi:MAG: aspartate--tRNA(Asn) ligase [Thermoproteota archaeon]|nr:aspartate--tRNA(Asn) ligase [Candidatus Brockarchaeota archaeon]MBO3768316.1 aspartate--tRNA(Asn) ligase [Candidatus Brockarchaeota archaeon]MBO3801000.1 aspartate--tRNA(Asn) ligase [Candidatus Brockarchaeota archaeon]